MGGSELCPEIPHRELDIKEVCREFASIYQADNLGHNPLGMKTEIWKCGMFRELEADRVEGRGWFRVLSIHLCRDVGLGKAFSMEETTYSLLQVSSMGSNQARFKEHVYL